MVKRASRFARRAGAIAASVPQLSRHTPGIHRIVVGPTCVVAPVDAVTGLASSQSATCGVAEFAEPWHCWLARPGPDY